MLSQRTCDLAVFVALPEEGVDVRRRIRPNLLGSDGRIHGEWSGLTVRLQQTGTGLRQAEAAARRMLEAVRPRLVVCAGLAGGLHPALSRGTVVVAEQVVDVQGRDRHACDAAAVEAAVRLGAPSGVLMTAPRVVCGIDEKRALSQYASLVDMESLAVARVADAHGVPFVAVRVISDAAHEGLPVDLNTYLDGNGAVRRGALALAALRRPGGLAFLLGMRATTQQASRALADFLERLLVQGLDPRDVESARKG